MPQRVHGFLGGGGGVEHGDMGAVDLGESLGIGGRMGNDGIGVRNG